MKVLLTLALLCWQLALAAQPAAGPLAVYTDARARYQLTYPRTWQVRLRAADGTKVTFEPLNAPGPAQVSFTIRPLPDSLTNVRLLAAGRPDSVLRRIGQRPLAQVLGFEREDNGRYEELRYDYLYRPVAGGPSRLHVVGRQLWRGGYELRIEYEAESSLDSRYLAEARQLVASFGFTEATWPSRRYADQVCNDKMYGIAALRYTHGQWEDDCRTIHEFSVVDPTARPTVHRRVLPFQSYALAKGFDNCLYAVSKAPTDAPERVYRYNPATRKGSYTTWQLPAQGPDNVWISGATSERGELYFMTSDANLLVKINPFDGKVTPVWTTDPLRKAPYYPYIGFASAGTHGNFCLDDTDTIYMVYSTDGSLLTANAKTRQPGAAVVPLNGLPERGGYSGLLLQNDAAGRRQLYMAGPRALYRVDLARGQASRVRGGIYTDLAGCNLFKINSQNAPTITPPATATWQGRVLSATTAAPLPAARFRLEQAGSSVVDTTVRPGPSGAFAYASVPGRTIQYQVRHPGYFPADSTWLVTPGPLVRDVLLRPLVVGATLPLTNVQFEQSRAILLPGSAPALNRLVALLTDNPSLTIELRGHTDNVGPPEKNVVLSQQRVAAVQAYLTGHGVAGTRVVGLGLGGAEPIADNDQEATRRLNRRVEFRITSL